jgi:outer membrane protein assembly factor BamB
MFSETQNLRWKTPIHGRGWASPVIWNNQIWLTTATEDGKQMFAICVDFESGQIIHDLLVFENPVPEFCHAMNSYASPTPVIEEGRVYVHFGSYGTACLNTATGDKVWQRRDLPCNHFRGPGSSPILFENLLITHYDGFDYQYVVALDKETGDIIWKVDRDVDYETDNGDIMKAFATPLIIEVAGQPQLISPTSKATIAYDPRTGKEIWRVRYEEFSATARPLFGHDLVFVNTGFSKANLLALKPGQGDLTETENIVWTVRKNVGSKPSQLLIDNLIFMIDDNGVASSVDVSSGSILWAERIGDEYSGSPIYADGKVYLFGHEGQCTVIKPGPTLNILATNKLNDGFMSSPAAIGHSLIVRSKTSLYRIEETQSD